MSHASSRPKRTAHGDAPEILNPLPERRRLDIGAILALNAGAALAAWLVGSLALKAMRALLHA